MRIRLPRRGIPLSASATLILLASVIAGTSVFAQVKVGSANAKKKNRVTRVVVDTVRSEPMRQTIPVLGRFVARQTGPVAARVAGAIGDFASLWAIGSMKATCWPFLSRIA